MTEQQAAELIRLVGRIDAGMFTVVVILGCILVLLLMGVGRRD